MTLRIVYWEERPDDLYDCETWDSNEMAEIKECGEPVYMIQDADTGKVLWRDNDY